MKQLFLFLTWSCLLLAVPSFAKGHGHGGGHGGGHSGGHASHSSGHTSSHPATHTTSGRISSGGHAQASHSAPRLSRKAIVSRSTSASAVRLHHSGTSHRTTYYTAHVHHREFPVSYYPYYYYPYYPSPFFFDPYYSMWSLGLNFWPSPHYYSGGSPENNNNDGQQDLEGYVVYANDTISGALSILTTKVLVETADSARGYDYTFKIRNQELKYVTAYNNDEKQIKLVRLPVNKKKLWRVVHEGKLNLYDDCKGFIYEPGDIDKMLLVAVVNGEIKKLNSFNGTNSKEQLTNCVNEAYGLNLDPKNFTWNELLIYIDKLD